MVSFVPPGEGGGEGHSTKVYTRRLRPEVQPPNLSYTIFDEKVLLLYTFHRQMVTLLYTYFRNVYYSVPDPDLEIRGGGHPEP